MESGAPEGNGVGRSGVGCIPLGVGGVGFLFPWTREHVRAGTSSLEPLSRSLVKTFAARR